MITTVFCGCKVKLFLHDSKDHLTGETLLFDEAQKTLLRRGLARGGGCPTFHPVPLDRLLSRSANIRETANLQTKRSRDFIYLDLTEYIATRSCEMSDDVRQCLTIVYFLPIFSSYSTT